MLRSIRTKLAHNTTIPNLWGDENLKPLQDLIFAEKALVQSLQKLSENIVTSSLFSKRWGVREGDDLGDVLASSSILLGQVALSLNRYADDEQAIRVHMKSVRTREESLNEIRQRRRTVVAKAESAERKLSRMGTSTSEEKQLLEQQRERLNELRAQVGALDSEILTEEAGLNNFKRLSSKTWMTLKFGGLVELAKNLMIVGESGLSLLEEIPLVGTQPGLDRPAYTGQERTELLVSKARRRMKKLIPDSQPTDSPVPNRHSLVISTSRGDFHLGENKSANRPPLSPLSPRNQTSLPPSLHLRSLVESIPSSRPNPFEGDGFPAQIDSTLAKPIGRASTPTSEIDAGAHEVAWELESVLLDPFPLTPRPEGPLIFDQEAHTGPSPDAAHSTSKRGSYFDGMSPKSTSKKGLGECDDPFCSFCYRRRRHTDLTS